MKLSEQDLQLIQKYIDQALTSDEQAQFDEKMKQNAFRDELVFQQGLVRQMQVDTRQALKSELRGFLPDTDDAPKTPSKKPRWNRYARMALAVFLILSALIAIRQYYAQNQRYSKLYASHFQALPPQNIQRGLSENIDQLYRNSISLYRQQNYTEAYDAFDDLIAIAPDESIYLVYAGISAMQADKSDEASYRLTRALEADEIVRQHAQWYLALNHVKTGDAKASVDMLDEIITEPSHLYYRQAVALKRDL